jgi:DNA polymerase III delta subunit
VYFDEFAQKLAGNELPSFLLVAGDAEDVMTESLRRFRSAYERLHPGSALRVLDGAEQDLPALLAEAGTTSLFGGGQLVVMRRAEKRVSGKSSDEALALLNAYLSDPNPGTCLALSVLGLRRDSRLAKLASSAGWYVQCAELASWKAVPWIQERATEAGLRMDAVCAQTLLMRVGADMGLLGKAIEQWATAIHPRTETAAEDLASTGIPGSDAGVFEFLDLVGGRRMKEALHWAGGGGSGEPQALEEGALAMMCGRVRELLAMASLREDGLDEREAVARMRMHPYRGAQIFKQSRNYRSEELERALIEAIRLQAAPMTGRLTKAALLRALERWMLRWRRSAA